MTEWQPDLLGGPGVPAERTPPMVEIEPAPPLKRKSKSWMTVSRLRGVSIVRQVSEETGVPVADIMGQSRRRRASHARQLAYARMRATGASYPSIGAFMGRDHATVLFGVRQANARECLI